MKRIKLFGISIFLLAGISACTDDLNTEPKVQLSLEQLLQQDPNAIEGIMSKLYGSFALSGPNGPGSSDISDDPGESPFLRGIVNLQDFTADGMKNRWGDDGLDQLTTTSNWDENNKFFRYLYNRAYYTIPQCNNLINILGSVDVANEEQVLSEIRFLRSLSYYYLIDCFGKGVLATENNFGETSPLPEASRIELFNYVESELLAIENTLPNTNSYGRANKSVARMLLAKLYLNAEVYTGTARYTEALTFTKKVKKFMVFVFVGVFAFFIIGYFNRLRSERAIIREKRNKLKYFKKNIEEGMFFNRTTWVMRDTPLTDDELDELMKTIKL